MTQSPMSNSPYRCPTRSCISLLRHCRCQPCDKVRQLCGACLDLYFAMHSKGLCRGIPAALDPATNLILSLGVMRSLARMCQHAMCLGKNVLAFRLTFWSEAVFMLFAGFPMCVSAPAPAAAGLCAVCRAATTAAKELRNVRHVHKTSLCKQHLDGSFC